MLARVLPEMDAGSVPLGVCPERTRTRAGRLDVTALIGCGVVRPIVNALLMRMADAQHSERPTAGRGACIEHLARWELCVEKRTSPRSSQGASAAVPSTFQPNGPAVPFSGEAVGLRSRTAMDVGRPGDRFVRLLIPQAADRVVQGEGCAGGALTARESGVHVAGYDYGGIVGDRPECADDVLVTGQLECRGEVNGFVGQASSGLGGGAGGKVGELRIVQPKLGDMANGKPLVVGKQEAARGWISWVGRGVAGKMGPACRLQELNNRGAGGVRSDEGADLGTEALEEQVCFCLGPGQV